MGLAKVKEFPATRQGQDSNAQVRQILIALNGAFKKLVLYPSEHVIYQSSLRSLKKCLDTFIEQHGNLELTIDRHSISYQDEVVYEGPMNEENLAFILFRDGIYFLEFQASIKTWELQRFLDVLKTHQVLTEDIENDIVTALWELRLPSLLYKAEDVGFDYGEEFEVPELGQSPDDQDTEEHTEEHTEERDQEIDLAHSLDAPMYDKELWEFTPEDQANLKEMLIEEEERDQVEYVFYILLYVLRQQTQSGGFEGVMDYLAQELRDTLAAQKFISTYKTINILKKTFKAPKTKTHWSYPLLDWFFTTLSSKEFLSVLQGNWAQIAACDSQKRAYLMKALLLLKPDAIQALGPMLLEVETTATKKLLMVVIRGLAEQNFEPMGQLAASADTDLLKLLVHIMGFMENPQALKQLYRLLRHEEPIVRKESLKAISRNNLNMMSALFWLMDDSDEGVQQLFFKFIGQRRDVDVEQKIRDHLQSQRFRSGDKDLMFRMYRALGKCGSDDSIAFLKKELFILPSFGLLRPKKSLRRRAAHHALNELKTAKAEALRNRISKRSG